jgi:succinate dehydrogenase/fumarate reductase flavoprotein subunit
MKAASITAAYAVFYPTLAEIARQKGYALAIHGTMLRDCDFVAIPWTPQAVEPIELIDAMKRACGGCYWSPETDRFYKLSSHGTKKPHGRIAYSVHLTDRGGEGPYFDVSVMPRLPSDVPVVPNPVQG